MHSQLAFVVLWSTSHHWLGHLLGTPYHPPIQANWTSIGTGGVAVQRFVLSPIVACHIVGKASERK